MKAIGTNNGSVTLNIDEVGEAIASCIEVKINEELLGTLQPQDIIHMSAELFLFVLRQIASNFDLVEEKDAALQEEKQMIFTKIISSFIVNSGLDKLTTPDLIKPLLEQIKNERAKSTMH